MAVAVLPYSAEHYNTLPSIADAGASFTDADIGLLTSAIGKVFVRHQVQNIFGIILLHNHFSLENDEILVNIGPVAVPWKTSSLAKQLDDVRSSAWRIDGNGLIPYEFTYDAQMPSDLSNFQPFLSELSSLLQKLELTGKLGLCTLANNGQDSLTEVEFTQRRANITLPFDIEPGTGADRSIEAVWKFESSTFDGEVGNDKPSPVVLKKCKVACKTGPNTGHQGQHKTTNK